MDYFQFPACRYPAFPATFVEEAVFSPLHILGVLVKKTVILLPGRNLLIVRVAF
jgi:hypothetical protein